MIFAFWFFVWLGFATAPLHLLLPGLALVVRVAYVEKRIPTFPAIVVVFWLLLAAFTALLGDGPRRAFVLLLQVFLSTVAIFHLLSRLGSSRLARTGSIGQLYFFLTRALTIVATRGKDIAYWTKVRVQAGGGGRLALLRALPAAGTAYLLEMVAVRNRIDTVVDAKGGYPATSDWLRNVDGADTWIYPPLGDLVVLAALTVPIWLGESSLVPLGLLEVISFTFSLNPTEIIQ